MIKRQVYCFFWDTVSLLYPSQTWPSSAFERFWTDCKHFMLVYASEIEKNLHTGRWFNLRLCRQLAR